MDVIKIKNYTTQVSITKTLSEIEELLVRHNARKVLKEYNGIGDVTAITFSIETHLGSQGFKLYFDWRQVAEILSKQFKTYQKKTEVKNNREKANQVGWRIIKDWLFSQLSIVEIGLAEIQQVLLPYMCYKDGSTIYQRFIESNFDKETLLIEDKEVKSADSSHS